MIGGKHVDDAAKVMACTVADVNLALDRAAQVHLTAQAGVRSIFVDAARLRAGARGVCPGCARCRRQGDQLLGEAVRETFGVA